MAHFVLTFLFAITSAEGISVDWSEQAIHFYGPVDIALDTAYTNELNSKLNRLFAAIPLDANRTLADAVSSSRNAQEYFRSTISFPQVVSTRYSTSGEVQNEYVIPLTGPFIEDFIPSSQYTPKSTEEKSYEPDTSSTLPAIPVTGFIIDARGTGFSPSIFPRLMDSEGNVILDAGTIDRNLLLEKGYIHYAYSSRAALQSRELGLNPLRIIAERATGNNQCDLVIPSADVERISESPLNQRLLSECRVIIVIDK